MDSSVFYSLGLFVFLTQLVLLHGMLQMKIMRDRAYTEDTLVFLIILWPFKSVYVSSSHAAFVLSSQPIDAIGRVKHPPSYTYTPRVKTKKTQLSALLYT